MAPDIPVTDRILGEIQRMHGCDLDTLTKNLSDLSWSQAFLEVDRLSRQGNVRVTLDNGNRYMIRLPDRYSPSETHGIKVKDSRILSEQLKRVSVGQAPDEMKGQFRDHHMVRRDSHDIAQQHGVEQ